VRLHELAVSALSNVTAALATAIRTATALLWLLL
jgi:hypothetical protein